MFETIRHRLPLLAAGQAQKEITHNEALALIDRLLHPVAESRGLAVAPSAATPGTAWIVPTGASGAWAGADGRLAVADGPGWQLVEPFVGLGVWVRDEGALAIWDGGWSEAWPASGLSISGRRVLGEPPATIAAATGGTTVDTELRGVTAALIAALRAQGILA